VNEIYVADVVHPMTTCICLVILPNSYQ